MKSNHRQELDAKESTLPQGIGRITPISNRDPKNLSKMSFASKGGETPIFTPKASPDNVF